MSEEQIERRAERQMDRLDARYMRGDMTESEYAAAVAQIDADTRRAYRNVLEYA